MSEVEYAVADGIAEIRLNRAPVNALSLDLVESLIAALRRAAGDEAVRCVILASALDKAFCAGLDLDLVRGRSGIEFRRFLEKLYMELYDVQYRLGKPSIAVVEGAARAGGMTVALSCDMVVAGDKATFGYPEIDVGIVPALHFVHLPRVAGRYRAFEPLFTGESFDADRAMELGLLTRKVASGEALASARELAAKLASKSPLVMRIGREAFMRSNDLDYRRGFEQVAETLALLVGTEDAQEGLTAFVEKRPPKWTGR